MIMCYGFSFLKTNHRASWRHLYSLWVAYENQNLLTSAAKLLKIGTAWTKKPFILITEEIVNLSSVMNYGVDLVPIPA